MDCTPKTLLDPDLARRLSLKLKAPVPAMTHGGAREQREQGPNKPLPGERKLARRLRRDRPDLWSEVESGKKSLNKAAIEAGFRRRLVQVEPTVEGFDRAIAKHLPEYKLVLR